MQMKQKVMAFAILAMLLPTMASADTFKTQRNYGSAFGTEASSLVLGVDQFHSYRYQWFGYASECSSSRSNNCTRSITIDATTGQSWNVGIEVTFQEKFPFGDADDTLRSDWGVTRESGVSDTFNDDWSPGYTSEPVLFVKRNYKSYIIWGGYFLVKKEPLGCGTFWNKPCYFYTWKDEYLGFIDAKVDTGNGKAIFRFLSYKNGTRSDKWVLETVKW